MKGLRTLAADLAKLAPAPSIDAAALAAFVARLDKEINRSELQTKRFQKDKVMMAALLTNTSRDLEASLLAQKRFLASVSYEIRTPLNSIIGFMELLADTPLTERQQEYLQNSLGSSRHLLALINVEMVRHTRFDLVLMDIQMPVMDGIRATREIRQFDAEVPIVALSANAFAEDIDEARVAGMNDSSPSPCSGLSWNACFAASRGRGRPAATAHLRAAPPGATAVGPPATAP